MANQKITSIEIKANSDKEFFLIHGYTGSPTDFNRLPYILNKKFNANVKVILLKGHGTKIEDLDDVTYEDLKKQISAELKKDIKKGRKIILGGVSLGALFALLLASEYSVKGVFDICPPYFLKFPFSIKGLGLLGLYKKYWKKHRVPEEKRRRLESFSYDYMHANGLKIVKEANAELKSKLKEIKCPILNIHSYTDPIGHYKSLTAIGKKVKSYIKEEKILDENKSKNIHNIFYSANNYKVYEEIVKFIEDNNLFDGNNKKNLNIAFFTESYKPYLNGVVQSILSLRESLESKGHKIYIFTSGKIHKEKNVFSCPKINFTQGYGISFPVFYDRKLFKKMDIFHTHQPSILGKYAMKQARRYNKPFIMTNHAQYHKYLHYVPFGNYFESIVISSIRKIMNSSDKVVLPCKSFETILINKYKVNPSRITIIPNGIIYPKIIYPKKLKENPSQKILIFTGRMGKEKNIYFLLDSFKLLLSKEKNIKLYLVGGGPEFSKVKEYLKKNGLEKEVIQTGYIPNKEVFAYLKGADIFVSASKTEIHPITLLEAMYCGLASVTLNTEGFKDTIRNSVEGFLVEKEDSEIFVFKLLELINNSEKLEKMKVNAAERSKQYSVENTSKKIEELYNSLLDY